MTQIEGHGGDLALAALRGFGVEELFTLSGGHVFPLYDAAHKTGVRDRRRAARAVRRLRRRGRRQAAAPPRPGRPHRRPRRHQRRLRPDQRAPSTARRWSCSAGGRRSSAGARAACRRSTTCRSSRPVTKHAATVTATDEVGRRMQAAALAALTPHRGPVFVDLPLDVVFSQAEAQAPPAPAAPVVEPDPDEVARRPRCSPAPQRPVIIAGSDVWAGRRRRRAAGGGRGAAASRSSPTAWAAAAAAEHPLAFSRARGPRSAAPTWSPSSARRWTSGSASATSATPQVVHVVDAPTQRAGARHPGRRAGRRPARDPRRAGRLAGRSRRPRADWIARLRGARTPAGPRDGRRWRPTPTRSSRARVYGELRKVLAADAVTIGDGGDFVSYAGKYLEPAQPGTLARPGPVRLPRHRHGLRDGRPGHLPGPAGLRAAWATAPPASR